MSSTIFNVEEEIIHGWNSRINSSSLELSKLVPFVNLVALFDNNDLKSYTDPEKNKMDLLDFKFKNNRSSVFSDTNANTSIKGAVIGKIESQLQSGNQKGGAGINSLEITRGTKEAFNIRYNMKMTIMDPDIFDLDPTYGQLISLNSVYLLMYGWTAAESGLFTGPPLFKTLGTNIIDLKSKNNGFWKGELCKLYKFDFSFDDKGHIDTSLTFSTPNNAALTFIKSSGVATRIKQIIDSETIPSELLNSDSKIISNDPNVRPVKIEKLIAKDPNLKKPKIQVFIDRKTQETITVDSNGNEVSQTTIDDMTDEERKELKTEVRTGSSRESKDTYYHLGWVLEALKDAVSRDGKENINVSLAYQDIEQNNALATYYQKFYDPEGDSKTTASKSLFNVFQLPLDKAAVDLIIDTPDLPVLDMIRSVTDSSIVAVPNVQVSTKTVDGVLHVFVPSVNVDGLEIEIERQSNLNDRSADSTMFINFGVSNSLCYSMDLSSKLDPNAFELYKLPVPLNDTIEDLTTGKYADAFRREGLDDDILKIIEEAKPKDGKAVTIDAPSVIDKLVSQDTRNYRRILRALSKDADTFGKLLGLYLKRTSITIHGTVGINAYNLIGIRGVIKKLEGVYNILTVTEQLNKDSFITVIEAALKKPFNTSRKQLDPNAFEQ